jgi:hypothetical protein
MGIVEYQFGTKIAQSARSPARLSTVGWSNDPNVLAVTLLTVVPFLFIQLGRARRALRPLVVLCLLGLCYAIYFTNSRGGVLTLAVVLTALAWRRFGAWRAVIIGGVLIALFFKFGPSRMQDVSLMETSARGRMVSLADGMRAFWSSPLFGVGAYGWSERLGALIPHCAFVRCAAEVGIFGLLLWVLTGLVALKHAFFVTRKCAGSEGRRLGASAEAVCFGCGAFLAGSIFLPITYYFPLYVFVALSAVSTRLFLQRQEAKYSLFDRGDFGLGLLITCGGVLGFELVLRVTGMR